MAKRIRKSALKFTQVAKVVNSKHIQLTCDQLVSTCVGWPNDEKTCVDLRTNLSLTKVVASGWPAKRKSKTYVDLGVCLASA